MPRPLSSLSRAALATAAIAAAGAQAAPDGGSAAARDTCATQVAHGRIGPRVHIVRGGVEVPRPQTLQRGDAIRIDRGGRLGLTWDRTTYQLIGAGANLQCATVRRRRELALLLQGGAVTIHGSGAPVAVLTPEALLVVPRGRSLLVRNGKRRRTIVRPRTGAPVELAPAHDLGLRLKVHPTQAGLMDASGLRLDTYPFAVTADQRPTRPGDGLVPFWDDGRRCSRGCRPAAIPGWPIKPFHRQHALRAGLNELRPANFHVGIDIQAHDFQAVYPMSSGRVHVIAASGHDERVQVGRFVYWHIDRHVGEGAHVRAYRTVLGTVKRHYGHVHLSELLGSTYINPLRHGGRVLRPWVDREPPVVGLPRIGPGGSAVVAAFDPQSFVTKIRNETPVLAPAAIAWRLFDAAGHRLTPLEWAYRGSQHMPDGLRRTIYAPGATNPGFLCFARHPVCRPNWRYRLAGGLTPRLPVLGAGRYRLTAYAWDWAGNTTARDLWFRSSGRAKPATPEPPQAAPRAKPDVE